MPKEKNTKKSTLLFSRTSGFSKPMSEVPPVDGFVFNNNELNSEDIIKLNLMISCFNNGDQINVSSRRENLSPDIFGSLCQYLYGENNITGPFLAILPPEVLNDWKKSFSTINIFEILYINGSSEERENLIKTGLKDNGYLTFNIALTTLDNYINDYSHFENLKWAFAYVCGDLENKTLKINSHCIVYNKFELFDKYSKKTHELISTLCRIDLPPDEKDQIYLIQKQFQLFFPSYDNEIRNIDNIPEIHYINCPLLSVQRQCIKNLIEDHISDIKNKKFTVLRKKIERICHHPYLLLGNEKQFTEDIVNASSKMIAIDKILSTTHNRIVFVSDYIRYLDIIEDYLTEKGVLFTRDRYSNAISLIHLRDLYFFEVVDKADTIVFVDTELENIKGKKRLIRLSCDDLCETKWRQYDDETICKFAYIKASQAYNIEFEFKDSKSPKQISQSVLNLCKTENFWDDYVNIERKNEPQEEKLTECEKLTIRQRNQFIRCIFNNFWGHPDLYRNFIGMNITNSCIKKISDIIVRRVLSLSSKPQQFNTISDILTKEQCENNIIDFDEKTTLYFKNNADKLLKSLQILRFLECAAKGELKMEFQIPDDFHEAWWTKEHSAALLKYISVHGFGCYDDIDMEEQPIYQLISDNVTNLGNIMNYSLSIAEEASKSCPTKSIVQYFFVSPSTKENWTDLEIIKIIDLLFNNGIPLDSNGTEDYKSIVDSLQLRDKTAEQAEMLIREMTEMATAKNSIEFFHDHSESFIEHIMTMKDLHFILDGRSDDELFFILHRTKKWQNLPKLFTQQLELKYFRMLLKQGFDALPEIAKDEEILAAFGKQKTSPLVKFTKLSSRIHTIAESIRTGKEITEETVSQYIKRSRRGSAAANTEKTDENNGENQTAPSPKPKSRSKAPKPKPPATATTTAAVAAAKPSEATPSTAEPTEKTDKPPAPVVVKSESKDEVSNNNENAAAHRKPANGRITKETLLKDVTFPFEITATTKVHSLGKIVWDRPAYHTERYVYPVGYKISRVGKSTTVPNETVVYISEILDNGEAPLFRVHTEDGSQVFEGATPTAPWSTILKEAAKLNNTQGRSLSVSGPEMYLISNQQVYNLMLQMPDIDKCEGFTPADIKPRNGSRRKKPAEGENQQAAQKPASDKKTQAQKKEEAKKVAEEMKKQTEEKLKAERRELKEEKRKERERRRRERKSDDSDEEDISESSSESSDSTDSEFCE